MTNSKNRGKFSFLQYSKTLTSQKSQSDFTKNSLLLLAPFAAATVIPTIANGQSCGAYGSNGVNNVGTFNSCPDNYIDIDGDGTADFNLYQNFIATGTYFRPQINALNSNAAILGNTTSYGFQYPGNVGMGSSFTAGLFPNSFVNGIAIIANENFPLTTYGNFEYASDSGFIPIRFNGNLGWIEITINNGCITVGSFGVEDANGGNDGVGTVIAGNCATLPVEFLSFNAVASTKSIGLKWETATEVDNLGFEVQRSVDGKNFSKIGWIDGNNTTSKVISYDFNDDRVIPNQEYFYRLKQIDYDGNYDFSKISSAMVKKDDFLYVSNVIPNPSSDIIELELSIDNTTNADIKIFNNVGQEIMFQNSNIQKGSNTLNFDISNYPIGNYYIKMIVNNESYYKKFTKF